MHNFGIRYTKKNGKVKTDWYKTEQKAKEVLATIRPEFKAELVTK